MGYLVILLLVAIVAGGLMFRQYWHQEQIERFGDQARLKVIETEMAGLRATLRINAAEHVTRRRIHDLHDHDLFANSTVHEEPEAWQR